jgi:hypothetical protein
VPKKAELENETPEAVRSSSEAQQGSQQAGNWCRRWSEAPSLADQGRIPRRAKPEKSLRKASELAVVRHEWHCKAKSPRVRKEEAGDLFTALWRSNGTLDISDYVADRRAAAPKLANQQCLRLTS